ncbi:MAG: epoxide hydrolase [Sphingomonadales bacterium]|nr:epoxide hydrolase [Sphingomonadales bacterium]MBU3994028.1 epoxide hydrolase [Alphaproteobacteria bacterium]
MREFAIEWRDDDVRAVLDRVAATRLPQVPVSGWDAGCDPAFLERFRAHWLGAYDWRAALADLNRYPQFIAEVDGLDIHFLHVRGESEGRRPLLLTHGWPGSHYEFFAVIEELAFPSRFGGKPDDAFDLVIPSLPGYAYSGKPAAPIGPRGTAKLWNTLMTEVLGYPHYLAQGGDWGSIVTSFLGADHAGPVRGIHLNMLPFRSPLPPEDEAGKQWLAAGAQTGILYSGYSHLQMTKPNPLAFMAAGNPLGQAAWILERFHDWADLGGREVDEVFGMDHLITNAMLYVMPESFASSLYYYYGFAREGLAALATTRCDTPTAYAAFPGDALMAPPPRNFAERMYNITRWTPMPRGGHFAAMEQPRLFLDDVRAWGREIWP